MSVIRGNGILLAVGASAGELPSEFRLFVKGWNDTENGRFLFDDDAAKSVMSSYGAWGVDLAIDLEHQMLADDPSPDPTSRDARGWCNLEIRADGSLWAVNVRWTPDGAARLAEKRQRYISPAFEIDPETKRVSKMINVAITAMPATHKTPALVAASTKGSVMDSDLVKQALDAIEKGDAKGALEILKGLVAAAAGAEVSEDEAPAGSEGTGAEGAPMPAESSAPPMKKDGEDDGSEADDEDEGDDEKKKAAAMARKAFVSMLKRETGATSLASALVTVQEWRSSHMALSAERAKLAAERAALEAEERRALAIELIKLGAEYPSTMWADDKASKLKARWAAMPIAELRAHVADQKAARGAKKGTPVKTSLTPAPAATDEDGGKEYAVVVNGQSTTVRLSANELRYCAEAKADVQTYATNKAYQLAARR